MAFRIEGGGKPLYIFYDSETTGLKINYDGIIEIGAVVYTKGLRRRIGTTEFHSLIYTPREISEHSSKMTGLTNADLRGQPSLTRVLNEFFDWIHDIVDAASRQDRKHYVPVLAAHSGSKLDFPMLLKAIERIESVQDKFLSLNLHFVDTFNVFKSLQSNEKFADKLERLGAQDIYEAFFLPTKEAHRALNDAKDLRKIFSEAPPADVFMTKLETYIQSKDGLRILREQVGKFLKIQNDEGENFFKAYEAVDLIHNGITFEDLEEEFKKSERHFRRFLAQKRAEKCSVTTPEREGDLIEGLKNLDIA